MATLNGLMLTPPITAVGAVIVPVNVGLAVLALRFRLVLVAYLDSVAVKLGFISRYLLYLVVSDNSLGKNTDSI